MLIALLFFITFIVLGETVVFVILDKDSFVAAQEKHGVWKEDLAARYHFLLRVLFRLGYEFHDEHVKGHVIVADVVLIILLLLDLEAPVLFDLRLASGAASLLLSIGPHR